jgi:hypothetical protein
MLVFLVLLVSSISSVGKILSHFPSPDSFHDGLDIDGSLFLFSLVDGIVSMVAISDQVPSSLNGIHVYSLCEASKSATESPYILPVGNEGFHGSSLQIPGVLLPGNVNILYINHLSFGSGIPSRDSSLY